MACFLVPTAEAIVTTAITKVEEKKEKSAPAEKSESTGVAKVSFVRKLHWLNCLLFGGAILLAFEHLWHGEISFAFPFLTGGNVLHEMMTVGVAMTVLVTAVWGLMCLAADAMARRENRRLASAKAEK